MGSSNLTVRSRGTGYFTNLTVMRHRKDERPLSPFIRIAVVTLYLKQEVLGSNGGKGICVRIY